MSVKLFKSLLLLEIAIVGSVWAVFDVRIETFSKIEGDTETLIEFNLRLVGRQHLLNGTVINHVDFDDTYEILAKVEVFVNGEWKVTAMSGHFKFCVAMNGIYERHFESSFKNSTMPKGKNKCPFRKGKYYIINALMESDNWSSYAKRGLNKFQVNIMKNGICYGGFVTTALVTDRSF